MRILFLNKMRKGGFRTFDYENLESVRGAERTILYLAEALAQRDHQVIVASSPSDRSMRHGNVEIAPVSAALRTSADVAISNNYAMAFDGVRAPLKVVWTHNPGFSWTHIKADILAKLRHRPHVVHLSEYTRRRSWFLPSASQAVIRHGMPTELLANRHLRVHAPAPVAVFSSYAGRNLRTVLEAWRDVVHPAAPSARLLVTSEVESRHLGDIGTAQLNALNIEIVGTLPWSELMDLLRSARVLAVPGHFQETFNLLSVEAAACGLPTATMGIGALRERVCHNVTGWRASSVAELGWALVRILTDDELWHRYHRACLSHPDLASWEDRALEWDIYLGHLISRKRSRRP